MIEASKKEGMDIVGYQYEPTTKEEEKNSN